MNTNTKRFFQSKFNRHLVLAFTLATAIGPVSQSMAAQSEQPALTKASVVNFTITKSEVLEAQKKWGEGLTSISAAFDNYGIDQAVKVARKVISESYGYEMGQVLFKPTLTSGEQTFRLNFDSALAYFVGQNAQYPLDKGFALNGWRKVEFKNAGITIIGTTALTTSKVTLTNNLGEATTVDKSLVFKKDSNGQLKIILHHSSLPFNP